MIYYIKKAILEPKEIYVGRNMKNTHLLSIVLSLVLTLTFLSLFDFYPTLQNMQSDITEVKESIPSFTLENNQLESPYESYVYQTDTILFYFDSNDRVNPELIQRNMNSVSIPVSIGILKEELIINLLGQNFSLQYANLDNFSTEDLQGLIESFGEFSLNILLIFLFMLFIFQFITYLVQFLPIVLFANIISVYRRTGLRFQQTAKIALLATILPALIIYAINALLFNVYFRFELLIAGSIFLYYSSITEMKTRIKETNSSEN